MGVYVCPERKKLAIKIPSKKQLNRTRDVAKDAVLSLGPEAQELVLLVETVSLLSWFKDSCSRRRCLIIPAESILQQVQHRLQKSMQMKKIQSTYQPRVGATLILLVVPDQPRKAKSRVNLQVTSRTNP